VKIDKRLHLVVPIYDEDDDKKVVAHVHSTPLPAEMVDEHWLLLSQTFSQVYSQGLGRASGPAVAMRLLRVVAQSSKTWQREDGTPGPAQDLIEEIRRLTMVVVPTTDGKAWVAVPLDVAVNQQRISLEDKAEVENAIVFFIASCATLPRAQRRETVTDAAELWGARITSLNSTAFAASLTTSIATDSSGATAPSAAAPAPPAPQAPPPTVREGRRATVAVDGKPASVPH
jgi:hypothetical protein